MKRIFLVLLLCVGWGCRAESAGIDPTARELLERTLERLRSVHTARYVMEQYRYESPADSFYSDKKTLGLIECENPSDTSGLAMSVVLYPDGRLYSARNENAAYWGRNGYIERNDMSRWFGVRYSEPPFFNHVTRLCEYLLRPGGNKVVTVKDGGDSWIIDVVLNEYQLISFHGNAYVSRSYPDEKSLFTLIVDKNTMMPSRLSYLLGLPVMRWEKVVRDVEINPVPTEGFKIETYLPELPVYEDGDEERRVYRSQSEANMKRVGSAPLPTDTLSLVGGGTISLSESTGKVRVILLTSNYCGYCKATYPVINKLMDDYAADGDVEVFGVILQSEAEMAALEAYRGKNDIHFPLAQNNGRFYEYFIPSGMSPAILVIDRDNKVQMWQYGFSESNSAKIDAKIRKMITRLKTGER